jgi:hypothetical protein
VYVADFGDPKIDMYLAGNFGWGYLGTSFFAPGSPLSIASDGTLSYAGMPAVPTASDTVLGKVQLGGGLSVTEDGTVSLTNLIIILFVLINIFHPFYNIF